MKHVLLLVIFSLFLTGNSLAMDDQPLFAMDEDQPLVVMLASSTDYPTFPFSSECTITRKIIIQKQLCEPFARENAQLQQLALDMQEKTDNKNKILYAMNQEVLFALYYVAKNPTHFNAVVLQNSAFHPREFSASETFFRDIPTLEKCKKIPNNIPIIFASQTNNDQMFHTALRLAGKNAHLLPPFGVVCNRVASTYSREKLLGQAVQQLNEDAVKAVLHREEKERIHRYKEYGLWAGIFLLASFLSHKSGLLEKIVDKLSFK